MESVVVLGLGQRSRLEMQRNRRANELHGDRLATGGPSELRPSREKEKRPAASLRGRNEKKGQQQQRQRALLGRTPTGLFQYYAPWQVSLCAEWHVISVTTNRFDE